MASLQQRNGRRAVWRSGAFSDGGDAADSHSRGGHRQDAKEPFLSGPPPLNMLQRKPARPSVVPSVQRVNRTECPADLEDSTVRKARASGLKALASVFHVCLDRAPGALV